MNKSDARSNFYQQDVKIWLVGELKVVYPSDISEVPTGNGRIKPHNNCYHQVWGAKFDELNLKFGKNYLNYPVVFHQKYLRSTPTGPLHSHVGYFLPSSSFNIDMQIPPSITILRSLSKQKTHGFPSHERLFSSEIPKVTWGFSMT